MYFKKSMRNTAIPYLFIIPSAILIAAIDLYPIISGIIDSFLNINLFINRPIKFIGFENFINLFKDRLFGIAFYKSIIWTITILAGEMIIGFFIAWLLNRDIKGRKFFRLMVLIPWVIPNAIAGIIWKWIYAEQYGLLNYSLSKLGIISNYKSWLGSSNIAFWAILTVALWKAIPFVVLVILAAMQSISKDQYEAAEVDGANEIQKFFHITLPSIKNITIIVAILTSIWNFNQFEIIQVTTRGGPGTATLTMPIFSYELFLQSFQVSYASSAATIMLIIMIVPMYIYIKNVMAEK
ncbi:MAG: sugar ABC transporter permease [Actinobacteria bacterium]|nr:sugar ABC transporter permease [Cyanobacteriota bacterium]MCL5772582.1 sugar ABC transporter permease [Actinomycetota bacterium]